MASGSWDRTNDQLGKDGVQIQASVTMTADEARELLAEADEDDEVTIPESVLPDLVIDDIPDGRSFLVGTVRDEIAHLDWAGHLTRAGAQIVGEAEHIYTRKYWYSPLGLEQYMDLVRRAVETRHRLRGDAKVTHYDDDGAYVQLLFTIRPTSS